MLLLRNSFLSCLTLLLISCSNLQAKQEALSQLHQNFYHDYESNLHDFHREINVSLELRHQSTEFFKKEILEGKEQYFDSQDIADIHKTVDAYVRNNDVLLNQIAYRYRDLIDDVQLILTTEQATGLSKKREPGDISRKYKLYINPNDQEGMQYIKVIKLGLASALTLYDNFIIAIVPYQENGHFRRNINYDNLDNAKIIEKTSDNFSNLDNYRDTLRVVEFYKDIQDWEQQHPSNELAIDKDNSYFNLLINGSYIFTRMNTISPLDRLAFRTVRFRRVLKDILFDTGSESMNSASKIFGNGMGLVAFRQGHLKSISPQHRNEIELALMPGDLLLEKTPFRLTDRFIPGHWGHVAIWVGSKDELVALGVWDELPALYANAQRKFNYKGPSFQSQVLNGHKIIEALRPGVQINTLEHFLNIDDMAVLRDQNLAQNKHTLKQSLLKGFAQIGKEYDFNFDVETDTKIVCSELAFVVYDNYDWPIDKVAGRYTISPDHIAQKATGSGEFSPVMLYHDGKIITRNIQSNFNYLLDQEYDLVQTDLEIIP